jgi:hypothetical protein
VIARQHIWPLFVLCCTVAESPRAWAQPTQADWLRADKATVRLNPAAFTNLPQAVRTGLQARGCLIPQPSTATRPTNVITGHFTSAQRTDWAVLCSRGGRSAILVFRGGRSKQIDEIGDATDLQYLQVVRGNGEIGYSRRLGIATANVVRHYREQNHSNEPRTINHDGIAEASEGTGSVIWYLIGRKWLQLPGAD